jgi:hypothetical protein
MLRRIRVGSGNTYHLPRIRSRGDSIIVWSELFTACGRVGVSVDNPEPSGHQDCLNCVAILFMEGIVYE